MRLRGTGLGMGMALGTAAVVRTRGGLPLLPEVPARIMEMIVSHRLTETPEVILVAEDYRTAWTLAGALTWAKVVGIAAQSADPDAPVSEYPAVVNVPELLNLVEEDMLLLVDAGQGTLLVDPEPVSIALYQAEHDHLAPKRRLYLDTAHLPARTLDGRTIQVIAIVENEEAVEQALSEGADALYVPFDSALLPADAEPGTIRRRLFALNDMAAGKPLILSDDYALPLPAVLEAATRADLTLAVPPRDDLPGLGLAELAAELEAAQAECVENDVPCSLPRLAVNIVAFSGEADIERDMAWVDMVAAKGATRLIVSLERAGERLESLLPRLSYLVGAANANLLPVPARLRGDDFADAPLDVEASVRLLVGIGVAGILTHSTARTKEIVGELSYSECQEQLLHSLSAVVEET